MKTEEHWYQKQEKGYAKKFFTERIKRDLQKSDFPKLPDIDFESGRGLYLHGITGSGKTLLAAKIMLEEKKRLWLNYKWEGWEKEQEKIKEFEFITTPKLIHDIRQTFNLPNPEGNLTAEQQIFNRYTKVYFLVLDDFGVTAKISDWVLNTLYLIINARLEYCLPTVFTSNLDVSQIAETFDDRIAARIKRMCDIVKKKPWDKDL